ncbi:MAG: PilX N-terminal domain-containing pilus assembly protein [Sideroxydans sp.]|nr:PilX N-terminal domain-containing pilus assembly protein [Sideroxydans sp.]
MKLKPIVMRSRRESGAVLITGLIFMTLVMLIALSVMRSATLEERMAANSRNRQLALEAAEAVVRDAELSLFSAAPFNPFNADSFVAACTSGLCTAPAAGATPRWQTMTTNDWAATATTRTFASNAFDLAGVASQPRYIVEFIGQEGGQTQKICPKLLFRIIGRGVGADGSEVFVEDIYRHRPAKFSNGSCG